MREIAFKTSLGLGTVRTIIGRKNGTKDRVDKHERAHWKSQKRTGDALPKQVEHVIETGQAPVREAKGLGGDAKDYKERPRQ